MYKILESQVLVIKQLYYYLHRLRQRRGGDVKRGVPQRGKESHTKIRWLDDTHLDHRALGYFRDRTNQTYIVVNESSVPDGKFSSKMEDSINKVVTVFRHERSPWYCKQVSIPNCLASSESVIALIFAYELLRWL